MQANRRKFMSAVAGVGATLAIAGCSSPEEGTETEGESMDGESTGSMTESMTESMDDDS